MNTVTIRGLTLGAGRPKIIVPLVGKTRDAVLEEAAALSSLPLDMAEWRVDCFEEAVSPSALSGCLRALRGALGETPLLATFRTAQEGGAQDITREDYVRLCRQLAASGDVDCIDVQAFSGDDLVRELIEYAHRCGVKVVASSHDFDRTPPKEELVARLRKMQALGADIPKLAVMPRSKADVLALLSATEEMVSLYADRPIITMSMGSAGVVSRVCGQTFGSAATFGCAARASAPGQMDVWELYTVLKLLEKAVDP